MNYKINANNVQIRVMQESLLLASDVLSGDFYSIFNFNSRYNIQHLALLNKEEIHKNLDNLKEILFDKKDKSISKMAKQVRELYGILLKKFGKCRKKSNYDFELDTEQIQIINFSLDFFSRILHGQIKEISNIFSLYSGSSRLFSNNGDEIRKLINKLHVLFTGLPVNSYHSIHSREVKDEARIAFDILQVFRHQISWDSLEGVYGYKNSTMGVNFNEPYQTSKIGLLTIRGE